MSDDSVYNDKPPAFPTWMIVFIVVAFVISFGGTLWWYKWQANKAKRRVVDFTPLDTAHFV